jgi:hypothetical protein
MDALSLGNAECGTGRCGSLDIVFTPHVAGSAFPDPNR